MVSLRGKVLGAVVLVSACKRDALERGLEADASAVEGAERMLDATVALGLDAGLEATVPDAGCRPRPECGAILTKELELGPCCTASGECGLEFLHAGDMGQAYFTTLPKPDPTDPVARCAPVSKLFTADVTLDSLRVPRADGGTILVTSSCQTALFDSLEFSGCCMPNNVCGLSTHAAYDTLEYLFGAASEPFTHVECVSSAELNAQFVAARQPGFANFVDTGTACDFAALDLSLARPSARVHALLP